MRLFQRSDGRYYAIAMPIQDLFGDRVLIIYHGNKATKLGGIKTYFSATDDAIEHLASKIIKLRLAHGYKEVYT